MSDDDGKLRRRLVELADVFLSATMARGGRVYPGENLGPDFPNQGAYSRPARVAELPAPRPPIVYDPDTGGTKRCETDDECENPEQHRPPPCPPGQTRSGPGGRCAQPFDRARGPLPAPILRPPPPATPADVAPPRARAPRPGRISRVGSALGGVYAWVLGTLVFGPYLGTSSDWKPLPQSSGPPRRKGKKVRTRLPPELERERIKILGPVWIPEYGVDPTTRRNPRVFSPQPLPPRPQPMPRKGPSVRTVPTPTGWTLGDPIPGPAYDPYTYAPPTPSPRRPAQPFPQPRAPAFPFPTGLPLDPRLAPRRVPRLRDRPLTPQPRRVQLPRQPTFTPNPNPSPLAFAQPLAQPTQSNPCTAQRTARRRKQKQCKKFTTKTIRVCADKE